MEFKEDDSVIVTDARGIHVLEYNKSYVVIETKHSTDGLGARSQIIALEGVENEDDTYNKYPFFNSKRFKKAIRLERKLKLKKIYGSR